MASLDFKVEDLDKMSRSEIQSLCKKYKIRANLKTTKMIYLLKKLYEEHLKNQVPKTVEQNTPLSNDITNLNNSTNSKGFHSEADETLNAFPTQSQVHNLEICSTVSHSSCSESVSDSVVTIDTLCESTKEPEMNSIGDSTLKQPQLNADHSTIEQQITFEGVTEARIIENQQQEQQQEHEEEHEQEQQQQQQKQQQEHEQEHEQEQGQRQPVVDEISITKQKNEPESQFVSSNLGSTSLNNHLDPLKNLKEKPFDERVELEKSLTNPASSSHSEGVDSNRVKLSSTSQSVENSVSAVRMKQIQQEKQRRFSDRVRQCLEKRQQRTSLFINKKTSEAERPPLHTATLHSRMSLAHLSRTSVHSTITKKGNEQSIDEYWKYKMQRMNNLQNSVNPPSLLTRVKKPSNDTLATTTKNTNTIHSLDSKKNEYLTRKAIRDRYSLSVRIHNRMSLLPPSNSSQSSSIDESVTQKVANNPVNRLTSSRTSIAPTSSLSIHSNIVNTGPQSKEIKPTQSSRQPLQQLDTKLKPSDTSKPEVATTHKTEPHKQLKSNIISIHGTAKVGTSQRNPNPISSTTSVTKPTLASMLKKRKAEQLEKETLISKFNPNKSNIVRPVSKKPKLVSEVANRNNENIAISNSTTTTVPLASN